MKYKLLIAVLFSSSLYFFGILTYKYNFFPLSVYREYKINKHNESRAFVNCPVSFDRNASLADFYKYSDFSKYGLILGDSVVEGMFDPRPYGLDGWVAIGQDSQTTECLDNELDHFIQLKPREILLYIGGNDADRNVPLKKICTSLESIVVKIKNANIPVSVSEIHFGLDERRKRTLVSDINKCIKTISTKYEVKMVTTPTELTFDDLKDAQVMSTDGEHLDHKGYSVWINHIKKSF